MYIPPVIIPGKKCCCEPKQRNRRPNRCHSPRRRRHSQEYDINTIINQLQPIQNIQIPPLPPPPPRPPRQFYKPIIQQADVQMENALNRCQCKLEKYKYKHSNCKCQLENCMCQQQEQEYNNDCDCDYNY